MNKYIHNLIKEQFSISDIDFTEDNSDYDANIFNKNLVCLELYDKFIHTPNKITSSDIDILNSYVSAAPLKDLGDFIYIVKVYSDSYRYASLNWLDISGVTDMSLFFYCGSKYTGDISKWDVSNVKKMACMFTDTDFNSDISEWDVSNVEDMSGMFINTSFNQDISGWDVSNVTNMKSMFSRSRFNSDISKWDVSNVKDMCAMFFGSSFNKDISGWDVSNVTNMRRMFNQSCFNHDISQWDVSNVTEFEEVFDECKIREEYKPVKFR